MITIVPSRMPRPECAPPPTDTRSVSPVTKRTHSIGTPSHSVDQLRKARLVALAAARWCRSPPRRRLGQNRDLGAFPAARRSRCRRSWRRRCRGSLPRFFASARRRGKPVPVGERERARHDGGIVAAVVDHAERISVRHRRLRHQIAPAKLDAIEAESRAASRSAAR